jgi:hypothetical protein
MTVSGLAFRQPQKWTYPFGRQQKTEINWTSASIVETAETGVVISNGKEVLLPKKDTSHTTRCCLEPFLRIAATHNEPLVICASIGDGKHSQWNGRIPRASQPIFLPRPRDILKTFGKAHVH